MKKLIKYSIIVLMINISLLASYIAYASTGIVIIVNKDNPVSELSISESKLYWLRKIKKRWPDINKNIKPVDRKSSGAEQQHFYKKVLNMSAGDVETYFTQKQYENAEKPQDKFSSDKQILDFVSEEIGAIGYVSSAADLSDFNVKIVCTIP